MNFVCFICEKKFSELDVTIHHLKIIHIVKDNVHEIKCVANNGCGKKYASFKSMRAHAMLCVKTKQNIPENLEDDCLVEPLYNETFELFPEPETEADTGLIVPVIECPSNVKKADFTNNPNEFEPSLNDIIETFIADVFSLKLNDKNTDFIFKLLERLVSTVGTVLFTNKSITHETLIGIMSGKFRAVNSQRKRQHFFAERDSFIQPQLKAIGTHWEMKRDKNTGIALPTQVQSTFPYVPISKTLITLFDRADFKKLYLDYNSSGTGNISEKHICEKGRYRDFCCSEMFSKNELFSKETNSIQIQIFFDGFELCDPLKPRAGVHTQLGVYFTVRNLPHKLAYNQNNIHLVALIHCLDFKTKHTDYNNLWDLIVNDISFLENTGIILDSNTTLKGIIYFFYKF